MCLTEFDQEKYENELKSEAMEEGIKEGIQEGKNEMILSLNEQGIAKDIIAKAAKVDISYVEEIINKAK